MIPGLSPELKALMEAGVRAGGFVSDGPVSAGFVEGWACHPFKGTVAHYWRVGESLLHTMPVVSVLAQCGIRTVVTEKVSLLGPGNYPLCQRCDAALLRGMKARFAR